jgi:hypothetical protein
MRRLSAIGTVLLLTACAAPAPQNALWRDASGQGRGDAALHTDEAGCDYEISMAEMGRPARYAPGMQLGDAGMNAASRNLAYIAANSSPRAQLEERCMAARGWQLVGFE